MDQKTWSRRFQVFSTVTQIRACHCCGRAGGVQKAATVVPEHNTHWALQTETNLWIHHKNPLTENEQEEWKIFKSPSRLGKGNEGLKENKGLGVRRRQADLMEMNKEVGKRESKKPKKPSSSTSEIHPGRQTESCARLVDWQQRSEQATQGREGATDLLSVVDKWP